MTASLISTASQVLWRILEAEGVDPTPIFNQAGLDPQWWNKPYSRFPETRLDEAWFRATELLGDPCIGLKAARFFNPASLQALGFAWLASDTLYDALSRLVRYSHLLSDGLNLQLTVSKDICRLTIEHTQIEGRAEAQRIDAFWAALLAFSRMITSEELSPKRLSLRRLPPPCIDKFYALFRAPVSFAAPKDGIEFGREIAERTLPTSNRVLAHANDQVINNYLAHINANDLPGRVKSRLVELLPSGVCSEAEVADALHVSLRTLQRRLADQGTSFKVLLDEARRELAMHFISEGRYSIKETSYLLGFAEPGNFSRAFRRWTGTTPSRFRESGAA
jgi:AraC-like DNA-binding protein